MKILKPNEGKMDRIVRIVAGVTLMLVGWMWLIGLPQLLVMIGGLVLVLTGVSGFCGLYALLGINTCPRKSS